LPLRWRQYLKRVKRAVGEKGAENLPVFVYVLEVKHTNKCFICIFKFALLRPKINTS